VSLDGVMQAPGGPTEDPTGGFEYGGWLASLFDPQVGETIDGIFSRPFDLLLGRRTYDIFAAFWPHAGDDQKDIRDPFNRCTKYVLTRRQQTLNWENSERVESLDALAEIKRGDGPDLVIQGSSTLYPQLLEAGLIDRLTLMIFPVVLGKGKRLFGDGTPGTAMTMVEQKVTASGAVIATYEPAGPVKTSAIAEPAKNADEARRQDAMADGSW
jgi:dihydrofolate reductase